MKSLLLRGGLKASKVSHRIELAEEEKKKWVLGQSLDQMHVPLYLLDKHFFKAFNLHMSLDGLLSASSATSNLL